MFRVDAVMAIDANYQPQSDRRNNSRTEANQEINSSMTFADHLNSYLSSTSASSQTQLASSPAASFLAWYYPPVMMLPKTEEKSQANAD